MKRKIVTALIIGIILVSCSNYTSNDRIDSSNFLYHVMPAAARWEKGGVLCATFDWDFLKVVEMEGIPQTTFSLIRNDS